MTSDRSVDDLPLAAYGGSGMELTAEDDEKLDAPPSPEPAAEPDPVAPVAPGPYAHASSTAAGLEGEPEAPPNPAIVFLAGLAGRTVTLLRTSRVAAGAACTGVIAVGLLLLVAGGQKPGAAGAEASPSAPAVALATREPANATLVLTGAVKQELSFTSAPAPGTPAASLAMTWTDPATNTLGLLGSVDRGTRTTDEALVLQWTVLVKEKPVTFTSTKGECTVGMAVTPSNVFGSFTCKKLKSDNGKYVVTATGTYRT